MRRVPVGKTDEGMLVYEDPHVLEAIRDFLSTDGTRLDIAVENDVDVDAGRVESHPVAQALQSLKAEGRLRGTCEIRKADPEQVALMHEDEVYCHSIIMDREAYRVEIDPAKAKAFVNSNDRVTAESLIGFFEDLYKGGQKLWSISP